MIFYGMGLMLYVLVVRVVRVDRGLVSGVHCEVVPLSVNVLISLIQPSLSHKFLNLIFPGSWLADAFPTRFRTQKSTSHSIYSIFRSI